MADYDQAISCFSDALLENNDPSIKDLQKKAEKLKKDDLAK